MSRRRRAWLGALLRAVALSSIAPSCSDDDGRPPGGTGFTFEEITLDGEPLALTEIRFVPGTTDEFFLLDKVGKVRRYRLSGDAAELVGSFELTGVFSESDCGLVSMAFDPRYLDNGRAYFGYCSSARESRISRHTVADGDPAAAASGVEIMTVGAPGPAEPWHNVGSIGFDPAGNLWAVFGDKALSAPAQDLSNELGSLVRVVPSEGGGFTVPGDNPFAGEAGKSGAVWAYGLRSPWRATLDARGRYWIGDVGEATHEEVTLVRGPGENLGWPSIEGPCGDDCGDTTPPLVSWDRSANSRQAKEDPQTPRTARRVVWVGPEYRAEIDRYGGALTGKVLYGDFCAGWVRAIEADDAGAVVFDRHISHLEGIVSWDVGPDGFLYVATYGNCDTFPYQRGRVYRFVRR